MTVAVSHQRMVETVAAYVAAFDRQDPEAAVALYAPDAVIEDPVGSLPVSGLDAIRALYARAMGRGLRLKLDGPVRTAAGVAAFAFSIHWLDRGGSSRIDVIDTFRFDALGRITEMRAFWGADNQHLYQESLSHA